VRAREGSREDLEVLRRLKLAEEFRGIPLPELATRWSWITLRRGDSAQEGGSSLRA
jgi:hypothetical protein